MTLYELLQQNIPNPPKYESGIKFLDDALDGGFEMGQLVTRAMQRQERPCYSIRF